jgi:hypothetical protein
LLVLKTKAMVIFFLGLKSNNLSQN